MRTSPRDILIIGAGIGGLCLAQGLRKSGMRVTVFERDHSPRFRYQGYRIHINPFGSRALMDCLPHDLFELFVETSGRSPNGQFVVFDEQLRQQLRRPLPSPPEITAEANRLTMREILLAGLVDTVVFSKTFTRFEVTDTQRVRVLFADGSFVEGDVLVGADGANSAVRRLLAPQAQFGESGRVIYGKTPLTPAVASSVPDQFLNGMSRVSAGKTAMGFGAYRKRTEFDIAIARHAPNLMLTATDDFLMWTVTSDSIPISDAEFRGASAQSLHDIVKGLTEGWHPVVRGIVDAAEIDATFPIFLRYAQPAERWPVGSVTLLGDAAHLMPPFRGVGANTALRDASKLCEQLIEVERGEKSLLNAISEYETDMLAFGFGMVKNSVERPLFGKAPAQS